MLNLLRRVKTACTTAPNRGDWQYALGLLIAFAIVYLPIGFYLEFLAIDVQLSVWKILGVLVSAFLMPGVNEELMFRALLIPHQTEGGSIGKRKFYALMSLVLFIFYHLHPFVPSFFRTPAFLIGAALVGVVCTLSYWKSGSIWPSIVLHWLIVVAWLLVFGGLKHFSG
ncbi:MAG: CPBP family intramembrane metalloprotease [Alkalinema sp. RU_4_3]|nr:CPBP family intramembrane metalloprotease [Alkalinema sp. RU_4_3]